MTPPGQPMADLTLAIPLLRVPIVQAFAQLPDEAFGFMCGVFMNVGREAGGFQHDSRAALEATVPLVTQFFDRMSTVPPWPK